MGKFICSGYFKKKPSILQTTNAYDTTQKNGQQDWSALGTALGLPHVVGGGRVVRHRLRQRRLHQNEAVHANLNGLSGRSVDAPGGDHIKKSQNIYEGICIYMILNVCNRHL